MNEGIDIHSDLERALWDVVMGLAHRDVSADIARQAGYVLPAASWSLLEYVERIGPMRVSDIAACQGVDISSVTPRLQALERAGLLDRSADPHDRRASVVSIGPAGRVALERIHQARGMLLAEALGDAEVAQVATAGSVLERIAMYLRPEALSESDRACPAPPAEAAETPRPTPLFDIPLIRIDGSAATLAEHAGKVLLIVNVASKCGLTPQYDGLEALYRTYRDRGLVVLGFPANDFAGQEPGSEAEISAFCRSTYAVDFPMYAKVAVTGPDKHPLYRELVEALPTAAFKPDSALRKHLPEVVSDGGVEEVHWNFEKFLIGRDGRVVARFAPDTVPEDPIVVRTIEEALAA